MTHVSRVISFVAVGLLLAASAWAQATARRSVRLALIALACLASLPASAFAQASITGVFGTRPELCCPVSRSK